MAINYIDWRNDKTFPYRDEIDCVLSGFDFYEEDDDFVVYQNDENGMYAVYYKLANDGELISLARCFDELFCLTWNKLGDKLQQTIEKAFKDDALGYGFPATHPEMGQYMTWRELRDQLNTIESNVVLDMEVSIDDGHSGFFKVWERSLSPYDLNQPAGSDNPLSITTDPDSRY